jgi:hypothetical protein
MALAGLRRPAAREVAERALELVRGADAAVPMLGAQRTLASLAMFSGDERTAAAITLDTLQAMRRKSGWVYAQQTLPVAGLLLARGSTAQTAARIFGAARHFAVAQGAAVERLLRSLERRLVADLGEARVSELAVAGEVLPLDRAMLLAEAGLAELIAAAEADPSRH